jgi:hypothetical protein
LLTTSESYANKKYADRIIFIHFLDILCVVLYGSFITQAAMVWTEVVQQDMLKEDAYNMYSVIYWIQYEFIIFMINLLAWPVYMIFMQITQAWYGTDNRIGGPRFMIQNQDNRKAEDLL